MLPQQKVSIKGLLCADSVKKRFEEMLGAKAAGFISSILSIVNSNNMLAEADPNSIIGAAAIAASLDLPINPSLGFAHIVPYRQGGAVVAQFQLGWKGFIQLAQRSGQYKILNRDKVYEGQLISNDPLSGEIKLGTERKSEKVIGYFFHFETITGFKKTTYMSKEECEAHGKKYSKSFGTGNWTKDFDSMALKTVVKRGLSQWGILSIELERAIEADQGVATSIEADAKIIYVDNPETLNASTELDKDQAAEALTKKARELKEPQEIEVIELTEDPKQESELWKKVEETRSKTKDKEIKA